MTGNKNHANRAAFSVLIGCPGKTAYKNSFGVDCNLIYINALADAGEFVRVIENRQGIMLSAVEEIAYHNGWIDKETLLKSAEVYGKSSYGKHLRQVADGKILY